MKRVLSISLFLVMASQAVTHAAGRGPLAVFATEKVMGERVASSFDSLSKKSSNLNGCEKVINQAFADDGFEIRNGGLSDEQMIAAKKFNTVFGRYSDLGLIPNDVAVKAAKISDVQAKAVVVCSVSAGSKRQLEGEPVCAAAKCRVIDFAQKKSVATAALNRCVQNPSTSYASVEAIKAACGEAGRVIAQKMAGRY